MEIKHLPFVAGMASLALILGAYSFEHIGGLYPCKLCLWQRYPHFLNILLIFLFYFFPKKSFVLVASMSMLTSTILALYHVGVEKKLWLGPNSCSNSSIEGLSTDQLLEQIMNAPLVRCDEVAWDFVNISMAGWNGIFSLILFLTCFFYFIKRKEI